MYTSLKQLVFKFPRAIALRQLLLKMTMREAKKSRDSKDVGLWALFLSKHACKKKEKKNLRIAQVYLSAIPKTSLLFSHQT